MKKVKVEDCKFDMSFLTDRQEVVNEILDYLDANGTDCDRDEDIAYFINIAAEHTDNDLDFAFFMYIIGMNHSIAIEKKNMMKQLFSTLAKAKAEA